MGKLFFTSDLHFGHDREFIWGPRGFKSVDEMNETLLYKWNDTVGLYDDVYMLGDFILGDPKNVEWVKRLNGYIHIAIGNHDTENRLKEISLLPNVEVIGYGTQIKYNKNRSYFLSHYPVLCAPWDNKGKINSKIFSLCGHAHTQNRLVDWPYGGIYHCELDAHNCFPKALDEIHKEINRHLSIF